MKKSLTVFKCFCQNYYYFFIKLFVVLKSFGSWPTVSTLIMFLLSSVLGSHEYNSVMQEHVEDEIQSLKKKEIKTNNMLCHFQWNYANVGSSIVYYLVVCSPCNYTKIKWEETIL